MSDEAFNDLMSRMSGAVNNSKTAHEQVKTASVADLDEPGDILANTIYGMNDQLRRDSFPEEVKEASANEDLDAEDAAEAAAAAEAAKTAEEYSMDEGGDADEGGDDKGEAKSEKKDDKSTEKEAGFGLSVNEDLSNPFVAMGFNAELKEHEPVIKQAVAKIVQASAVVS